MNRDKKLRFVAVLAGAFLRSAVLTAARILIISWYVYFALHSGFANGGYMFWIMFLLSTFGLWQLIELLAKAMKLSGGDERAESPEA